jgi:hypothetical protein
VAERPRHIRAAEPLPSDAVGHPADDALPTVDTLRTLLDQLRTSERLTFNIQRDPRLNSINYENFLADLVALSDELQNQIRSVVIAGIEAKRISRKKAAEIAGVHQATVARWYKEHQEYPQNLD